MFSKEIRRLILITFASSLLIGTGCSSSDDRADVESAAADVEGLMDDAAVDSALMSDQLPEDALGGEPVPPPDGSTDSMALAEPSTESSDSTMDPLGDPESPMVEMDGTTDGDLLSGTQDLPGMDPLAEPAPMSDPSLIPEPAPMVSDSSAGTSDLSDPMSGMDSISSTPEPTLPTDSSSSMAFGSEPEPVTPRPSIPLQKVADKPWKVGGAWINTVYFARPGDTLTKISNKLFGNDRSSALKAANPTYRSREPRPGDKVYYTSPNRPGDSDRVLVYHEDIGAAPEVYISQEGDNIRTVSRRLLGYADAWKEVWSSNTVESKTAIPGGVELRYWKDSPASSTTVAQAPPPTQAAPPPPAPTPAPPQEDYGMNEPQDFPPPPPQDMAGDFPPPPDNSMDDLPPPPPPMNDTAGMDMPPPPPPMDDMSLPPPPPPPPPPAVAAGSEEMGAGELAFDEDTMMTLGVAAFAALALVGLIIVRKKRKQREMEAGIGDHAS